MIRLNIHGTVHGFEILSLEVYMQHGLLTRAAASNGQLLLTESISSHSPRYLQSIKLPSEYAAAHKGARGYLLFYHNLILIIKMNQTYFLR